MVTAPEFFEKLRTLKPNDELRPGVAFVAILHYDKTPERHFDQPDALWIKCPKEKDVSSLLKAYKKACPEAGEFVLRHNFHTLEEKTKIAALANRYPTDFVALEAVRIKDLDKRTTAMPSSRSPLTEVTNTANRPMSRTQTLGKANSETPIKQYQPPPTRPPRASGAFHMPEPLYASTLNSRALQPIQAPSPLSSLKQTGWEDFLFERLEISRQSVSRHLSPSQHNDDLSATDQAIRDEWLNLDEGQKSYFVDRGAKITATIRSTTPQNWYAEHCAFWCYYYDGYFSRPAGTEHLDRDFDSRKSHIEDSLAIWKRTNLSTRKLWFDHAWNHATAAVKRGAVADPQWATSQSRPSQAPDADAASPKPELTPSSSPSPDENTIPQFDGPTVDFYVAQEDVPGFSNIAPIRLSISELFDGRTPEQLEKSVEKGVELLGDIQRTLQEQPSHEATQWLQAIENVQKQATRSKTVVGVVGATGAGKSSVINAMLDEERLVPTNCMRACTAVVTEISYNYEAGAPYKAEVEFITRQDWQKMLKILFQGLLDGSGQVSRECNNEDSESGIAYAQIKAVYPKMTKEEMENITIEKLMEHDNVACLGTTRDIESDDSMIFYKKLQRYVDSKEKPSDLKDKADKEKKKPREMEFWPLIRVVRLHVKAAALATGAVIVDLPGVHDSNQARAAVAQGYMKQCTGLWIVAPITRAVDDKSAKTLLGDTFKRQLKMDGGFNSVTFICSKTDDISITEAQDSLGLDEELTPMWEKSEELRKSKNALKRQIEELKVIKSDMNAVMEAAEEELELWEKVQDDFNDGKTVFKPKPESLKRKREGESGIPPKKRPNYTEPDSDDDFIDDGDDLDSNVGSNYASSNASEDRGAPLTEDEISMKIADLRGTRKEGRREKIKFDDQISKLRRQIDDVEKESEQIDGKLSVRCISGRNEYSRGAIRQDYAAGIRELDQEIAEEEDAANFDPEVDRRNYDEVFCVSSRAYQKLKGRLQKDKTPPGFTHVDETEVPALQAHCIQLTTVGRKAACRKFLTSVFQLLNSLRLWASNDGTGRNLTEGQLKREAEILKERLGKLDSALERAVTAIINGITEELQDKVYDAYPAATGAAISEANNTVRKWGSPVDRDNWAAGGLYWATYKAVVRRDGVFSNARASNNFNEQLVEPVIRHLAGPWESVFARRVPGILNGLPTSVGQVLATFHDEVERRGVRNGASIASFQMLKQQIPVYKETLKDAMNDVRTQITEKQRNINREFEPRILEHMLSVYHTCTIETGAGQYARMKNYMDTHVEEEKLSMFDDAVEHVRKLTTDMLKEVKDSLLGKVDAVFMIVERDYTGVVIGQEQGESKEFLPRDQRVMRKEVLRIIDTAEMVFKRAVGLESEVDPETDVKSAPEADSDVKPEPRRAPSVVKQESEEQAEVPSTSEARATPQDHGIDASHIPPVQYPKHEDQTVVENQSPAAAIATGETTTDLSNDAPNTYEDVSMQDATCTETSNETISRETQVKPNRVVGDNVWIKTEDFVSSA